MGTSGINLANSHCSPGAKRLTEQRQNELAAALPDWKTNDGQLTRTFVFPDFKTALAFVNRVGAAAEEEGHHPDILLSWGRVDIKLSTHDAGGLTENDFILAAKTDQVFPTR